MKERLSSPLSALKPHYDVAVVGSGYGGGVAAARLASAGRSVCVLERGREIATGEFPARFSDMQRETQVSSGMGHVGNPTGLFDIRLGKDVHVAMGCGLGGTSLINANVCLEPDPRVLEDPRWPKPVRMDGVLAEGLARARTMLRPIPYPGLRKLLKLEQLGASATALGGVLSQPPLHVTFERGTNAAGVEQPACTLCGDCCSGCNVGAKTTTTLTYLPAAVRYGAQIFTRVLVRSVAKGRDGKWRISIVTRPEDGWETRLTVTAGIVVLGAGTLGSTEILLRSCAEGLALSDRLGEQFTTNGDALASAYNNDRPVNSVGVGYPAKVHTEPIGPAVAGLVDLRGTEKLEAGLALVEASIPSGAAAILPLLFAGAPLIGRDTDFSLADQLDEAGRAVASLVTGAYQGAIRNTQTFLAVGHDAGSGRMRLEKDRLAVDWPGAAQDPVFQRIEEAFMRATAATGGTYVKNPLSLRLMGGNLLTVHPLGGCAMGADRTTGVVNHKGQVFDNAPGAAPDAVHDGLYVCDGSVLPRSLGIHPLLTITALAERAMIHLARDRGWTMAPTIPATPTRGPDAPPAKKPGFWARWFGEHRQQPGSWPVQASVFVAHFLHQTLAFFVWASLFLHVAIPVIGAGFNIRQISAESRRFLIDGRVSWRMVLAVALVPAVLVALRQAYLSWEDLRRWLRTRGFAPTHSVRLLRWPVRLSRFLTTLMHQTAGFFGWAWILFALIGSIGEAGFHVSTLWQSGLAYFTDMGELDWKYLLALSSLPALMVAIWNAKRAHRRLHSILREHLASA